MDKRIEIFPAYQPSNSRPPTLQSSRSLLRRSMSSFPLADLLNLQAIASEVNAFRYIAVATLTLFIYDYVSTLEDEISLVWSSRWSLIKYIFLLNRVVAFTASFLLVHLLLMVTDGESCKRNLYATVLMALMTFVVGEVVLFMRVYALWFCSNRILALLVLIYVPGIVGSTYATVRATKSAIAATVPEVFGVGCLLEYSSTDFWICYLVLLFHETMMLALILIRAFRSSGYSLSKVLQIVVKDGIIYYLCVLSTSIANLLVLLLATRNLRTFLILTQGVIHSILCARLLLRLRGAYRSLTSEGLHSMKFQSRAASTTLIDSNHESIPLQDLSTMRTNGV